MLGLNSKIVVADGVDWMDVDGEVLCLDTPGDRFLGLDEVGSRIWSGLAQGCSLHEVIQALHIEYEVDLDTLQADVLEFAESLVEQQLVNLKVP